MKDPYIPLAVFWAIALVSYLACMAFAYYLMLNA